MTLEVAFEREKEGRERLNLCITAFLSSWRCLLAQRISTSTILVGFLIPAVATQNNKFPETVKRASLMNLEGYNQVRICTIDKHNR